MINRPDRLKAELQPGAVRGCALRQALRYLLPFHPASADVTSRRSRSMPSVYIKTYGCQMNERDSEAVAAQLVARGYALAPSEAVADIILLNTCSVRDAAEQKEIGRAHV